MRKSKPTVLALTRRYLRCVKLSTLGFERTHTIVGDTPTDDAELSITSRGNLVIYYRGDDYREPVFHELCHALCGPESLDDETALMGFQFVFMKELCEQDYLECRKAFDDYSLPDRTDVGWYDTDDELLQSESFQACLQAAKDCGFLTSAGSLSKDLRVRDFF